MFIGLCTGIFVAFISLLGTITLTQQSPLFVGGAWLLLLIFYIILGVAFTRFADRLLHGSFGSEEWRVQRRMAILSGFPFYALCLLCLMASIMSLLFADVNAATAFVSVVGFLGFALVSCSYVLLLHFFLRSSIAMLKVKSRRKMHSDRV